MYIRDCNGLDFFKSAHYGYCGQNMGGNGRIAHFWRSLTVVQIGLELHTVRTFSGFLVKTLSGLFKSAHF